MRLKNWFQIRKFSKNSFFEFLNILPFGAQKVVRVTPSIQEHLISCSFSYVSKCPIFVVIYEVANWRQFRHDVTGYLDVTRTSYGPSQWRLWSSKYDFKMIILQPCAMRIIAKYWIIGARETQYNIVPFFHVAYITIFTISNYKLNFVVIAPSLITKGMCCCLFYAMEQNISCTDVDCLLLTFTTAAYASFRKKLLTRRERVMLE